LSCIIPDDSLGIKAEMDIDETDILQLLLTNLSMVGMISNHSYTTRYYSHRCWAEMPTSAS